MSKQWARAQVRRDEVAETVGAVVGFWQHNRNVALGVAAGVLVAAAAGGLLWLRSSKLRTEAWEKLAIAQSLAYQGQAQAADEQLKPVIEGAGKTAAFGLIFSGDLRFRMAQYKEAAAEYQKAIDKGGSKPLQAIAMADLALALEAAGDCKASAEANQRFLDSYQDHFLAPQAHASLARCQLALGQASQAKSTLDRISLLYPDTYWAQWAKSHQKS